MRKLPSVNVHTIFCRGCGIAAAPKEGERCATCTTVNGSRIGQPEINGVPWPLIVVLGLGLAAVAYGAHMALKF